MFFSEHRLHFFRPFVGKYREVVAECVRLLYRRFYTDLSGYGQGRDRDFIIDVFSEAIARAPVLDSDDEFSEGRFKSSRELAGFILNALLEYGWLERQLDEATLRSYFSFTRMGRAFTQPFIDTGNSDYRSRNRNTRNTRNSLQAFYDKGEVYDLLDAFEYSERIISDFSDAISELDERRLQLVKEVESRQLIEQAADQFFDFIDTVFKPDLEVRLSADNVEKYRDQISSLVSKIRRRRPYGAGEHAKLLWQTVMEKKLRTLLPGRVIEGQSLLENILFGIEERLKSACEIMLPALRRALNSFTARADIIIRQLSYLHTQVDHPVIDACRVLRDLSAEDQETRLTSLGQQWAYCRPNWPAADQFSLRTRATKRTVSAAVEELPELDVEAQKAQFIAQVLDQAFHISHWHLREFVAERLLQTGQVHSRHLPVSDAAELMAMAHLISVQGERLNSDFRIHVTPVQTDEQGIQVFSPLHASDPYFTQRESFVLTLVDTRESEIHV